ncbi:MAG: glycosyltransferase [Telluria sp.]|nr:glycosyltransferase [Telluria sp.]
MSTFVAVGNATQPFHRLIDAIDEIAGQLPQPVFVQFGAASPSRRTGWSGTDFLNMAEFERRAGEAQLLILHAGAGSVIHAIRAGKVPVVVPRRAHLGEHVDDHQMEFAMELEKTGKVLVAHDARAIAAAAPLAMHRQSRLAADLNAEPALIGMVRSVLHGNGRLAP